MESFAAFWDQLQRFRTMGEGVNDTWANPMFGDQGLARTFYEANAQDLNDPNRKGGILMQIGDQLNVHRAENQTMRQDAYNNMMGKGTTGGRIGQSIGGLGGLGGFQPSIRQPADFGTGWGGPFGYRNPWSPS